MNEIHEQAKKRSFYISIIYVGSGTVSLFAITSEMLMANDFTSILFMLVSIVTMPVSFLGFAILWGGGQYARLWMLLTQSGVFFVFWYIVYLFLLVRYKKSKTDI